MIPWGEAIAVAIITGLEIDCTRAALRAARSRPPIPNPDPNPSPEPPSPERG